MIWNRDSEPEAWKRSPAFLAPADTVEGALRFQVWSAKLCTVPNKTVYFKFLTSQIKDSSEFLANHRDHKIMVRRPKILWAWGALPSRLARPFVRSTKASIPCGLG